MNSRKQRNASVIIVLFGALSALAITANMSKIINTFSSSPVSSKFKELGTRWEYTEGNGWKGSFLRESVSEDTFAVKLYNPYTRGKEPYQFNAKVILLRRRHIMIRREHDTTGPGYVCLLVGTISSDGKHIDGYGVGPNTHTDADGYLVDPDSNAANHHIGTWSADIVDR